MKGPNILSNQFEVVSRWRGYEKALCSDFTKAYYSMQTGELEMHVELCGDTEKQMQNGDILGIKR